MGSDIFGANHGENAFEIEVMVDSGMTPAQALVASTSSAADLLGIGDLTGSVGKAADLILVDGDPLADVRVLQDLAHLKLVMRDGIIARDLTSASVVAG